MHATFDSSCPECGDDIYEGDDIYGDDIYYVCRECAEYHDLIDDDPTTGGSK